MRFSNKRTESYECVESELGKELWKYDMPGIDSGLKRRIEAHLTVCDACRLSRAIERKVAVGLRDGGLKVGRPALPRSRPGFARLRRGSFLGAAGVFAMAAAFILLFLLPPSVPDQAGTSRSALLRPGFDRPVEREVVREVGIRFSWRPIEGATRYRIAVREVEGPYEWSGETNGTSVRTPVENPLPAGKRFRALLQPVPADLARPGDTSVSFRTGTKGEVLLYRIGASPVPVRLLASIGLFLLLVSLAMGVRSAIGLTDGRKV